MWIAPGPRASRSLAACKYAPDSGQFSKNWRWAAQCSNILCPGPLFRATHPADRLHVHCIVPSMDTNPGALAADAMTSREKLTPKRTKSVTKKMALVKPSQPAPASVDVRERQRYWAGEINLSLARDLPATYATCAFSGQLIGECASGFPGTSRTSSNSLS